MQANSRRSSKEVVSVAVQYSSRQELKKLNTNQPLENIIGDLCNEFNVNYENGKYALQLVESQHHKDRARYITEISEVKDGVILELVPSASNAITSILQRLDSEDAAEQSEALKFLCSRIKDVVVAQEFFTKNGVSYIYRIICDSSFTTVMLVSCLKILFSMIKMRLLTSVDLEVLKKLAYFVTSDLSLDTVAIQYSLMILKEVVAHRKDDDTESLWIEQNIGMTEVKHHLWDREHPDIQKSVIALINALAVGENAREVKRTMSSVENLNTIYRDIICSNTAVSDAMAHELYIYQTLILGLHLYKLKTPVDTSGEGKDLIHALISVVTNTQRDFRRHSAAVPKTEESQSLPETVDNTREQELEETPKDFRTKAKTKSFKRSKSTSNLQKDEKISSFYNDICSGNICRLTLDFMFYFAKKYSRSYLRVMLEETSLGHSFATICEKLTQLLCAALEVGNPPKRDVHIYQPLLFSKAYFLPELFCRIVLLLGRTRRDMKARTKDDEEKVFSVVQRQLKEALALKPQKLSQLDDILHKITYVTVSELWQKEREKEELSKLEKCLPILELRKSREPEMIELIKEQRLAWLREGTVFPCYNVRGQKEKKKWWKIYLTTNHKMFHYADCTERGNFLDSTKTVALSNVANIVVGKKCPHVRETRNKKMDQEAIDLSFSLLMKDEQSSLDFVASDHLMFCYWVDGINVLLGREMNSPKMYEELKVLLDMEVRLLLLDIDGIDISNKPPPIPPPPPNYDFHDESSA